MISFDSDGLLDISAVGVSSKISDHQQLLEVSTSDWHDDFRKLINEHFIVHSHVFFHEYQKSKKFFLVLRKPETKQELFLCLEEKTLRSLVQKLDTRDDISFSLKETLLRFGMGDEDWDIYGFKKGCIQSKKSKYPFQLIEDSNEAVFTERSISNGAWNEEVTKLSFFPRISGRELGFNLWLEVRGNIIETVKPELGYYHRGLESALEGKSIIDSSLLMSSFSSFSAFSIQTLFFSAIEKGLDLQLPDRATALRMIFCEFERVITHIHFLRDLTILKSDKINSRLLIDLSESIAQLFNSFSGNRHLQGINGLGGITWSLPLSWTTDALECLKTVENAMDSYRTQFVKSWDYTHSLNIGQIDQKTATRFGLKGPNLRGSGLNYDLRKRIPYFFYDSVEFDVPIGMDGRCFERFLIRVEEIFQSIRIITQLLNNLPSGPQKLNVDMTDLQANIPEYFESSLELATGDAQLYFQLDEKQKVKHLQFASASMKTVNSLSQVLVNTELEETSLILSSLGIDILEVDK